MPLINQKRFDEAVRLHEEGRLSEAEVIYKALLAKTPKHPDLMHLYGVLLAQQGAPSRAIELIGHAIRLRPGNVGYLENLAAAQHAGGQDEAAVRTMLLAGDRYLALKQHEEAIRVYAEALELQPHNPHLLSNTGVVLARMLRFDEALPWFERAIAQSPDFADAILNRGNIRAFHGAYGDALADYRHAESLFPDSHMPPYNIAFALNALGRVEQSLAYYDRALTLKPDFAKAHHDKGLALLSLGRFSEGFPELDWRWAPDFGYAEPRRPYKQPVWKGGTVKGRLLVFPEQGYGDAILLSRYIPALAAEGHQVLLEAPAPLLRLFEANFSECAGVSIVPKASATKPGQPASGLPSFAAYVGLFSVPARLKTSAVFGESYLKSDAGLALQWAKLMASACGQGPRIGLVWAGEPREKDTTGYLLDRQRSLKFSQFEPFLKVPGLSFVSLQKGAAAEQLSEAAGDMLVYDPMPEVKDFADTAAIVENLDLVITVDTAVANLAGALGKPVWVLCRFNTDWRWMLEGSITPWYDSARVFRQKNLGDWEPVLQEVLAALRALSAPQPRT
jgi:tetratricopeptide (TPR) repeat protein